MTSNLALIGPEAAFRGPYQGGLPGQTDRARRVGRDRPAAEHPGTRVQLPVPTTPGPVGLPGPLRWDWDLPRAVQGSTRYTHPGTPPVYPPWYHTRTRTPATVMTRYPSTDHPNTRFWDLVGEPRGVEYSRVLGSQAGYIQLYPFRRPYDWV